MKKALPTLLMGLALVSCSTPEPRPTPMQLDFSSMGKISLTTQDLRVVNRAYSTPQRPPYVGHLFEPRLADAVEKWGTSRLQSTGDAGHATLIIKEASITQQNLPLETGFDSWFTRQQATKYVGRVEVTFEAQNPKDHSTGAASAQAVHSVTLPEDATETEKYGAYRSLVDALMKDLNDAFSKTVKEKMGRFLSMVPARQPAASAPPIITTPVTSAPLSQTPVSITPAVQAVPDPVIEFGPAKAAPIAITSP